MGPWSWVKVNIVEPIKAGVDEWYRAQRVMGLSPGQNLHQCLWTCLQVMLRCHADLYTVSRCHTRGESEDHTDKKACKKGSTLDLKLRAYVTRGPKQGYQWSHEKDLCPPKKFFKKKLKSAYCETTILADYLAR